MTQQGYRTGLLAWIGAGALLAAIGVGWYVLPISDWLTALRGWIVGLGFAGIVIFAAIYVVGAVVLAPEAVLTIAAGFAYGFWGLPIVVVAATIGASLAFLIARYLARDKVRQLLESRRNIAAIDKAVAEDGWKIVALLRLSPLIPFNLQNYLFGDHRHPVPALCSGDVCGNHPRDGAVHLSRRLGNAAGGGPAKWAFLGVGLLATVIVVVLVARKARAKLREAGVDNATPRCRLGMREP